MAELHSSRETGIDIAETTPSLGHRSTYRRLGSTDAAAGVFELRDTASSVHTTHSISQSIPGGSQVDIPLLPGSIASSDRSASKTSFFITSNTQNLKRPGWRWSWEGKYTNWRLGLLVGSSASALVLCVNFTILLVGAFRFGGYEAGIGTLAQGRSASISRMSTAYHILINLLSTVLLTSSNYCMQLLCSPTRDEVDQAHHRTRWLYIGVLSPHNLRHISIRRTLLWWTLAISSLPLHLFYNSAIFEVTVGQDYRIDFVSSDNGTTIQNLSSTTTNLSNVDWKGTYKTQFVPNAGNIHLVVDQVAFAIHLSANYTWQLMVPNTSVATDWLAWDREHNGSIETPILMDNSGSFSFEAATPYRSVYDMPTYVQRHESFPKITWPNSTLVNISQTHSIFETQPLADLNDTGNWLLTPPLHIAYALVEPISNSSSVQIGLYFMIVVLISNLAKFAAITITLRDHSTSYLVTTGDAIASFLERPDLTTVGMCNLKRQEIIHRVQGNQHNESKPWQYRRLFMAAAIRFNELGLFTITLLFATGVTIAAMTFALSNSTLSNDRVYKWGTASELQLGFANSSFGASNILLNAWLANTPQIILSASYFLINRLCTSMCIAHEWNRLAESRKGLRVTQPSGAQRSTYFLNLPYRWSIPLTIISGLLHWLLSQSLFLARREIRDVNGDVIPAESKCTCGYSSVSVLIFSLAWISLLLVVLALLLRKMTRRIPIAANCSLVISAACHASPDEIEPGLKPVQWGVVRSRFGGEIEHCGLSSEDVSEPQEGRWYA